MQWAPSVSVMADTPVRMANSSRVEIRGSVTDSLHLVHGIVYHIVGNFGKVFNLANW